MESSIWLAIIGVLVTALGIAVAPGVYHDGPESLLFWVVLVVIWVGMITACAAILWGLWRFFRRSSGTS
jgi:hypothetical protein